WPPPIMIHGQGLLRIKVVSSEAGPLVVFGRSHQLCTNRIVMDVIHLLHDHPTGVQGKCLETLLPHLVNGAIVIRLLTNKTLVAGNTHQLLCCETLQCSTESGDVPI